MAQYQTKFSLGDRVCVVSSDNFHRIVRCKPCGNTGKITIADEELICPKCNGRSTHTECVGKKFYIAHFDAIVGQVRVEHVADKYNWHPNKPVLKHEYMLDATGVGSGTVYDEERLFGSEEDAQEYCDKHNGVLPPNECEQGNEIIGSYGKVLREDRK